MSTRWRCAWALSRFRVFNCLVHDFGAATENITAIFRARSSLQAIEWFCSSSCVDGRFLPGARTLQRTYMTAYLLRRVTGASLFLLLAHPTLPPIEYSTWSPLLTFRREPQFSLHAACRFLFDFSSPASKTSMPSRKKLKNAKPSTAREVSEVEISRVRSFRQHKSNSDRRT